MGLRDQQTGVYTRGKFLAFYGSQKTQGIVTEPADVVITCTVAAALGATSLTLSAASAVSLKKKDILPFPTAQVMITQDIDLVAATPTVVTVDTPYGVVGEGILAAIAANDTANWDQLHWIGGIANSPENINTRTNELNQATYDDAQAAPYVETEIQGLDVNYQIQGNFKPDDFANAEARDIAFEPARYQQWVKAYHARENGSLSETVEGNALVTGYSSDRPATGIVTANWTYLLQSVKRLKFAA